MALRSVKSLLARTLMRHGVTKGVEAAQVVEALEREIVRRWGDNGRRDINVKFYRDGALAVSCRSSVWAQEMKIHEQALLQHVRAEVGHSVRIERIRFMVS